VWVRNEAKFFNRAKFQNAKHDYNFHSSRQVAMTTTTRQREKGNKQLKMPPKNIDSKQHVFSLMTGDIFETFCIYFDVSEQELP